MTQDKTHTRKPWFFGLLIFVVLAVSLLISRQLMTSAPVAQRKPPERVARLVAASPVTASSERVQIVAHGTVEAAQRSVLAARVSAEVVHIDDAFVPGNRVAAGTPLLKLDQADYALALAEAEASLATARASLAQEQGNQAVARADAAILDLEVSDDERRLMLREPQLNSAQASVKLAEAAVQRARLNLQRTTVVAPFDGVVLSRAVSVGSQVSASGSSLGELAAAAPYWVVLRVPTTALRWIEWPDQSGQGGSQVELMDAADRDSPRWSGRVIQLLDALESEGRRAGVLVEISEPQAGTRPLLLGTYVQARIDGRELVDALRLDNTWVHDDQVWVVVDGRLQARELEVAYRGSDHMLVTAGLQAGEQIVTSVPSGFIDGMRVRIQGQAGDTSPAPRRSAAQPASEPQR